MKQSNKQIKFSQISSSTFLTKIKTRLVKVGDSNEKLIPTFPKAGNTVPVINKRPV